MSSKSCELPLSTIGDIVCLDSDGGTLSITSFKSYLFSGLSYIAISSFFGLGDLTARNPLYSLKIGVGFRRIGNFTFSVIGSYIADIS